MTKPDTPPPDVDRHQHWEQVRAALAKLDGTRRARVALLSGISPEELDELGGVGV